MSDDQREHDYKWLSFQNCEVCNIETTSTQGGSLPWGREFVEYTLAECPGCGEILFKWEGPSEGVKHYMAELDRHHMRQSRRGH